MAKSEFQYDSARIRPDRALLVVIKDGDTDEQRAQYRRSELESLVRTMGMEHAESVIVTLRDPHPAFLVGTGKRDEIAAEAAEVSADCIVFDRNLNPTQQRNWEKIVSCPVIDRQEVILQIFADRASTREAVLQAALARQEYSLPRLTRAWTHLSRQRGGAKGTRGEGETQLEIDRRLALKKIARLKHELKKVKSHRETQRKQRQTSNVPSGSIVGYTNAGKSSLLHALSGAELHIEDKLFATLDPTTKRVMLPGGTDVLLSDTVGFVQDLPHDLVEAFKSTLEETRYADFILHVIDASHADAQRCYETTMEVLDSLGCLDKPMILVCNKIDLIEDRFVLNGLREKHAYTVNISAKEGTGLDELLETVSRLLSSSYPSAAYRLPADRYDLLALIRRSGAVEQESYDEEGVEIIARLPARLTGTLNPFLVPGK
jgi:GTPase